MNEPKRGEYSGICRVAASAAMEYYYFELGKEDISPKLMDIWGK